MAAIKTFAKTAALPERSTYQYHVTMKTIAGVDVNPAAVTSILLSLRDLHTDAVINGRDQVEVKDANGGTVTTGLFTMQFEDEDLQAVGVLPFQARLLTLDVRLLSGGRVTREIVFWVKSMQDIEAA